MAWRGWTYFSPQQWLFSECFFSDIYLPFPRAMLSRKRYQQVRISNGRNLPLIEVLIKSTCKKWVNGNVKYPRSTPFLLSREELCRVIQVWVICCDSHTLRSFTLEKKKKFHFENGNFIFLLVVQCKPIFYFLLNLRNFNISSHGGQLN